MSLTDVIKTKVLKLKYYSINNSAKYGMFRIKKFLQQPIFFILKAIN